MITQQSIAMSATKNNPSKFGYKLKKALKEANFGSFTIHRVLDTNDGLRTNFEIVDGNIKKVMYALNENEQVVNHRDAINMRSDSSLFRDGLMASMAEWKLLLEIE